METKEKKMKETKQEYLQNVLATYRMSHIMELVDKFKLRREEIKEALEERYAKDIYSPINSGSFAKHTAINSKFDLDIAIPFKKDSFDTIEKMFDSVFDFLYNKYKDKAIIRKQKVSIGIELFADEDGDRVSLDIVPGRELNKEQYPDDRNMNLYVNSKYGIIEKTTYIQTNIQDQIDHIKAKENERKIIRLLKIWKTSNNENYKSFLLELLVIKAFEKEIISGNLWEILKAVMQFIHNNVAKKGFTLKDPGNSNNNVVETLETCERENLSSKMKTIIDNIENNDDNIKLYFSTNNQFEEKDTSNSGGYGIKGATVASSIPPNNQRFGK